MKTTPLFLALMLVGVYGGQQPTEQEMSTPGVVTAHSRYRWGNGKAWKLLDKQSKICQVAGIESGMMLLLRESYPKISLPDQSSLEEEITKLTISGFRMADIVDQIDGFYGDSSNLRVPIADAYEYAMQKMHGAKADTLDKHAATLRAIYNR